MSFEYCRQGAMECRERTSRESDIRCWHGLPDRLPDWLNWRSATTRPPSGADTITSSGEIIKFIAPGLNPEAAA
jgi:hypothetical protein